MGNDDAPSDTFDCADEEPPQPLSRMAPQQTAATQKRLYTCDLLGPANVPHAFPTDQSWKGITYANRWRPQVTESDRSALLRELVTSPRNHCFVCGPHNAVGLHLRFEYEAPLVRAHFVPGPLHVGWQGIVHGGILAAVLDETMAYTQFFLGIKAVTAKMEIRYRAPVHAGDHLAAEAEITHDTRRLATITCRLRRHSTIVAESTAQFMKLGELQQSDVE